jgi:GNAT superfamily N-acetyltransferase
MAMSRVHLAVSDQEIVACFPVMAQLRPHLRKEDFLGRVRRQMEAGYGLAYVEDAGRVAAVAGFRLSECLAWGKFLYVDDLVTDDHARSTGHGGELLRWLAAHARENGCAELHLDSGVQRFGAHRFYLREGMDITSHHFGMKLV